MYDQGVCQIGEGSSSSLISAEIIVAADTYIH
jgi:hypothetical protein